MSDPLSRERVEEYGRNLSAEQFHTTATFLLAHDAAQRDRIAALEQETIRLKAKWHERRANLIEYYDEQLATLTAERDRLREALEALDRMTRIHKIQDLDAHAVINAVLRGEGG